MSTRLPLRELITVEAGDVEKALALQARDDPAVALVQRQLAGLTTRVGADRVNESLDIDLAEVLADGWSQVPAVRDTLARNARDADQSAVITLGAHQITTALHPVLAVEMAHAPLPALRLTLRLVARFGSAAVAIKRGRIEAVAPRDAALELKLAYGEQLLKERTLSPWTLPADLAIPPRDVSR